MSKKVKAVKYGRSLPGPSVKVLNWPGKYRWDDRVGGWQAATPVAALPLGRVKK